MTDDSDRARVFYRLVLDNPPSVTDFFSYFELGREPTEDPEWNRLASGYSVYDSLAYARSKAKRYPWTSKCFIAELHVPVDSPFVIEQTGPGASTTLFGAMGKGSDPWSSGCFWYDRTIEMYELWDAETRNVIRFFRSAAEADDVLSATVRKNGQGILDNLVLMHEDEAENTELVAEGQAILVAVRRLRSHESSHDASTPSPVAGRHVG